MLIAFQIILLMVILIGFIGTIGEKNDKQLRTNLTWITISAMVLVFLIQVLL
jgi:hypothetical protein